MNGIIGITHSKDIAELKEITKRDISEFRKSREITLPGVDDTGNSFFDYGSRLSRVNEKEMLEQNNKSESFTQSFQAGIEQAAMDDPIMLAADHFSMKMIQKGIDKVLGTPATLLSEDDWKASDYYDEKIPYQKWFTQGIVQSLYERKKQRDRIDMIQSQNGMSGMVGGFLGSLSAGAITPTSLLLGPIQLSSKIGHNLGFIKKAAILGAEGGLLSNLSLRAAKPFIEQEGHEVTDQDIEFATYTGAAFGVALPAISSAYKWFRNGYKKNKIIPQNSKDFDIDNSRSEVILDSLSEGRTPGTDLILRKSNEAIVDNQIVSQPTRFFVDNNVGEIDVEYKVIDLLDLPKMDIEPNTVLQLEDLIFSNKYNDGAPILYNNKIESAESSVKYIRNLYELGSGDEYKNKLMSYGYDIANIEYPLLVKERLTKLPKKLNDQYLKNINRPQPDLLSADSRVKMYETYGENGLDLYNFYNQDIGENNNNNNLFNALTSIEPYFRDMNRFIDRGIILQNMNIAKDTATAFKILAHVSEKTNFPLAFIDNDMYVLTGDLPALQKFLIKSMFKGENDERLSTAEITDFFNRYKQKVMDPKTITDANASPLNILRELRNDIKVADDITIQRLSDNLSLSGNERNLKDNYSADVLTENIIGDIRQKESENLNLNEAKGGNTEPVKNSETESEIRTAPVESEIKTALDNYESMGLITKDEKENLMRQARDIEQEGSFYDKMVNCLENNG